MTMEESAPRPVPPAEVGSPSPVVPRANTPKGGGGARVILLVAILMSISPFTMDMYLPAFPRMTEDLASSPSQIQLTLTGTLAGLALGQLVVGPLADAFGRRRPVIVGLSCHVLASLLCSLASDAYLLAGFRIVQGLSCAAVAVVAMATVRDLHAGSDYARVMSRMFLVIGVAPVIAPAIGGVVLAVAPWQAIFLALAGFGLILLVVTVLAFPETLPAERRSQPSFAASRAAYRTLLSDRSYLALIMVGGLMFATLFSYVSGGPFLFQDRFGLSAQQFAAVFAANGVGITLLAQVNPYLVKRFGLARVLTFATTIGFISAVALFAMLTVFDGGVVPVSIALAISVAGYGLSMPNSQALALNKQAHRAATAAALMGFAQFVIGAAVAPAIGLGGANGVAMTTTMLVTTAGAAGLMWLVVRRHRDTMEVR